MSAQGSSEHCRPDEMGDAAVGPLRLQMEDDPVWEVQLVRDRRDGRVVYITVKAQFANILLTTLSLPTSILVDILKEASYLSPIGLVSNLFGSVREANGVPGEADSTGPEQEPEPEPDLDEDVPSPPPAIAGNNGAAAGAGGKKKKKKKPGRKRKCVKVETDKQALVVAKPVKRIRTPAEERVWHLHIYKLLLSHLQLEFSKINRKQYQCPNAATQRNCSIFVADVRGRNCTQCRAEMTVEMVPNNGLVFFKDATNVVFSESLRATQLRNQNTYMELVVKGKEIQDMSTIEMCEIRIGIRQLLELAHAAVTSTTPLTTVFGNWDDIYKHY